MNKYFKMFEKISYDGTPCVNITRKADITEYSLVNSVVFYPYTIEHDRRADLLSNDYYKTPNLDWLLYITNNMIDPYYDYPNSERNIIALAEAKYGTLENAANTILYFECNWKNDSSELDVSGYQALPHHLKDYWVANEGLFGSIVSYVRKQVDKTVITNQRIRLTVDSDVFAVGDRVTQSNNLSSFGQVCFVDKGQVIVENVFGSWLIDVTPFEITNQTVSANVTNATLISDNFQPGESVYYKPVTALEQLLQYNENNRDINLLDSNHVSEVIKQFRSKLK